MTEDGICIGNVPNKASKDFITASLEWALQYGISGKSKSTGTLNADFERLTALVAKLKVEIESEDEKSPGLKKVIRGLEAERDQLNVKINRDDDRNPGLKEQEKRLLDALHGANRDDDPKSLNGQKKKLDEDIAKLKGEKKKLEDDIANFKGEKKGLNNVIVLTPNPVPKSLWPTPSVPPIIWKQGNNNEGVYKVQKDGEKGVDIANKFKVSFPAMWYINPFTRQGKLPFNEFKDWDEEKDAGGRVIGKLKRGDLIKIPEPGTVPKELQM